MDYLLDTSALIAYLANEKEAGKVGRLIYNSAIPFIALSEVYYICWRKNGEVEADKIYALLKSWHLPVIVPDEKIILLAGRFKIIFKLGLADSYIAACAFDKNLTLVTKDYDYDVLKNEIKIIFLH